jgi:hypothetical protein
MLKSCSYGLNNTSFIAKTGTLKLRYNNPFNNEIPAIKNLISNSSVVDFIVKSPSNDETPAIKNKIFGLFRFVKLRFLCITIFMKLVLPFHSQNWYFCDLVTGSPLNAQCPATEHI